MRLTKNTIDKVYQALLYFLDAKEILLSWDGVFHINTGKYIYCLDSDNRYYRPSLSNKLFKKLKYEKDEYFRSINVVADDNDINKLEIKRDIINVLKHHKNLVAQDDLFTTIKQYGSLPSIDELMIHYDMRYVE